MLMQRDEEFIHDPDGVVVSVKASLAAYRRQHDHNTFVAHLRAFAVCDEAMACDWHVLKHGRKNAESLVAELAECGIEAFAAVRKQEKRKGKKRRVIVTESNAMPGYLFVQLPRCVEAWLAVTTFKKVSGLLGRDGVPFVAYEKDVQRFQAESAVIERASPLIFSVDKTVRIREGSFAGCTAQVIEGEDVYGWLKVETDVFGRKTPINLHVDMIETL
ncbi:MAG: transcription termination/antitermination NusG family protein [Pseudomonadota bacterium]